MDVMLEGVLRAPADPRDYIAMDQLMDRAIEAADLINELETKNNKLKQGIIEIQKRVIFQMGKDPDADSDTSCLWNIEYDCKKLLSI